MLNPFTVDTSSILNRAKPKTIKIGIHSFSAGRYAFKKTELSLHRVRWTGGSLTRKPQGPFAVSWPRQLRK